MQQLSVPFPPGHVVIPAPPGAQLGGITHVPAAHVPPAVPAHAFPVLGLHPLVLSDGWHDWHVLSGLAASGANTFDPMRHPGAHVDPLQTSPAPHPDQLLLLNAGLHASQAFTGFA